MQLFFICPQHEGKFGGGECHEERLPSDSITLPNSKVGGARTINTNLRMPPLVIKFVNYCDIVYLCQLLDTCTLNISGLKAHLSLC